MRTTENGDQVAPVLIVQNATNPNSGSSPSLPISDESHQGSWREDANNRSALRDSRHCACCRRWLRACAGLTDHVATDWRNSAFALWHG